MRILHVEAGKHLYGGALQVHYLTAGLADNGVTSFLAAPRGAEIFDVLDNRVVPLPMRMKGDLDLGLIFRLVKAIRVHKIQLVHLHSRRGADLLGLIAGRLTKTPVVISRRVDNKEPSWFAKWKYHKCNKVITISEGIRKVLLDEGITPSHVETVLSAVDTQRYRPASKTTANDEDAALLCAEQNWFYQEFNLRPGQPVLAVLAQFIPRKGHAILFEALKTVSATEQNVQLLVFGKGPLEQKLQQQCVELGITKQVTFCGFRKDLVRVLPHLDLVVHPTYAEGLGVSLLQANACGVPVIASRVGGIPEIICHGDNGLLVDAGDISQLTESLTLLLTDRTKRQKMALAGRAKIIERFSIDAMVAGNLNVYKQCVESLV